jgi:NTP pyrophosphatase (non-canonical NTP hydrolase)
MIDQVFETSKQIDNGRSMQQVMLTVMEEVGELAVEIGIVNGTKDREPGKDGIIGESADVIAAVLDVVFLANPNLTETEFKKILQGKLDKWRNHNEIKLKESVLNSI